MENSNNKTAGGHIVENQADGLQIVAPNSVIELRRPVFEFVSRLPTSVVDTMTSPEIPRDDVFGSIDTAFRSGNNRYYVLRGPKGVGKTTVAYQYARSWQSGRPWMPRLPNGCCHHVRWFSAGYYSQLEAEYQAFAENCFDKAQLVKISGRSLKEIRPMVDQYWTGTNVLLIFDGVEYHNDVEEVVRNLMLMRPSVFILITTLQSEVYPMLNGTTLDGFTEQQVRLYLTSALHPGWSVDSISRLQRSPVFQELVNNHPKRLHWLLAPVRSDPTMTVDRLIDVLQNAAQHPSTGEPDAVFSIVVDALIAHCQRTTTCGWRLLRYAARLASAAIPVELLCIAMDVDNDKIRGAIQSLRQFSLLSFAEEPTAGGGEMMRWILLHSLARGEVAIYDASHEPPQSNNDIDVSLLTATLRSFHTGDPSPQWKQRIFPHVQQVLQNAELHFQGEGPYRLDISAAITLFHEASLYTSAAGVYSEALRYANNALELRRQLPSSQLDIASSLHNLGVCHSDLGDYSNAFKFTLEALKIRREALPKAHPDIASSLNGLGKCYSNLGDYSNALDSTREALDMGRAVLPKVHTDIASLLNSLSKRVSDLGNHELALEHALEALEMRRKVLPDPHPDIAFTLNNIGSYYSGLGNHEVALKQALEALDMMRKVLPAAHPGVALILNSVSNRYSALGKQDEALKYSLRALKIRRKVLPTPHPDIAASLNSIGGHFRDRGNHKRALKYALEAHEMIRTVLPSPHADVAASLHNLGNHYTDIGDHAQALNYALQALEMIRKVLPFPHPRVASMLNCVSKCYSGLDKHEAALNYALKARAMGLKVLPQYHRDITLSLHNIGNHYRKLGNHVLALKYYELALKCNLNAALMHLKAALMRLKAALMHPYSALALGAVILLVSSALLSYSRSKRINVIAMAPEENADECIHPGRFFEAFCE